MQSSTSASTQHHYTTQHSTQDKNTSGSDRSKEGRCKKGSKNEERRGEGRGEGERRGRESGSKKKVIIQYIVTRPRAGHTLQLERLAGPLRRERISGRDNGDHKNNKNNKRKHKKMAKKKSFRGLCADVCIPAPRLRARSRPLRGRYERTAERRRRVGGPTTRRISNVERPLVSILRQLPPPTSPLSAPNPPAHNPTTPYPTTTYPQRRSRPPLSS